MPKVPWKRKQKEKGYQGDEAEAKRVHNTLLRQGIDPKSIDPQLMPKQILEIPDDIDIQNQLGHEAIAYCQNDDVIDIDEFVLYKMMSPVNFKLAGDNNKYLATCIHICETIIAIRLKKGALMRTFDASTAMKLLPLVDSKYRDLVNDRFTAAIKAANANTEYVARIQLYETPANVTKKEK